MFFALKKSFAGEMPFAVVVGVFPLGVSNSSMLRIYLAEPKGNEEIRSSPWAP